MRTSSLFEALYTTSRTRVFRVTDSEPQEKLPWSRRRARNLVLPPRARTVRTQVFDDSLVLAAGRPSSYLQRAGGGGSGSASRAIPVRSGE